MSIIQGTALSAGGFYPYELNQSLRFNDDDNAYLSWTPASAGNRKTWTWSGWVKLGNISVGLPLLDASVAGVSTSSLRIYNNNIFFQDFLNTNYNLLWSSSAVLRDPSAWYHIVFSYDVTQATSAAAATTWINGIQQTLSFTPQLGSYVQNRDSYINLTLEHNIGRYYGGSALADGYLSEVNFIDGTALDATSFGEFKDGIWVPKKYGGSYGTNGFYLDFADGGALGDDESGNSNDWTSNNLVATDVMLDNPTNNFATLNPLDTSSSTLSEGNLKIVTPASGQGKTRANFNISSGKWYWEFECISATSDIYMIGVSSSTSSLSSYVGANTGEISYYGNNGSTYKDGVNTASYGSTYTAGDIVGVALNMDDGEITFYKNNVSQGIAYTGLSGNYSPAFSDGSNSYGATAIANFGQDSSFAGNKVAQGNTDANGRGDFYYEPPAGYLALCTANLPDPAILNGTDHFNTVLYTGNGSTQSITGVGFQPDFTWIKCRNVAVSHTVFDVVRGDGNSNGYLDRLTPDATTAEEQAISDAVSTFDTDGFSVNSGGSGSRVNDTSDTYVAWNWKADNTSGTTNTDGTITSTVSANPTAGFSIVGYTGTGASATVGHGLSAAPNIIIVKNRDAIKAWTVYSDQLTTPSSQYLYLQSSAAEATYNFWNNTNPTSSVFSVSGDTNVNASGQELIAYCFHSVEGYSKFGSYTGNGSADGPFVYTGFRPAFVIIKRTDSTANWTTIDNTRDTYNIVNHALFPDLSNAEQVGTTSGYTVLDFLSNGFKYRQTTAAHNASGGTYIYMAFAENPFKYSNAR